MKNRAHQGTSNNDRVDLMKFSENLKPLMHSLKYLQLFHLPPLMHFLGQFNMVYWYLEFPKAM